MYYAQYNGRSVKKGVHGDKKSSRKGYKAKINIGADGNYIELAENALYQGSSLEHGKKNDFHSNAKAWDYYVKTIKCDGEYFDVLINVKDTGNEQYVYDITLKEADSLPDTSDVSYAGSSAASTDSISETGENTTEKVRKSLKVDTKGYELTEEEKLFSQEYDEWDKKDFRKTFTLTTTSKALKEIGIVEKNITMDGVKILRILKEHPQMTDDVIKKIPSVILDPVLILQSKTSTSRVVMSGELYDADNNPVVVILG